MRLYMICFFIFIGLSETKAVETVCDIDNSIALIFDPKAKLSTYYELFGGGREEEAMFEFEYCKTNSWINQMENKCSEYLAERYKNRYETHSKYLDYIQHYVNPKSDQIPRISCYSKSKNKNISLEYVYKIGEHTLEVIKFLSEPDRNKIMILKIDSIPIFQLINEATTSSHQNSDKR